MASKAAVSSKSTSKPGATAALRFALLLRPMPLRLLTVLSLAVLLIGAAYCSGYEKLLTNRDNWPGSLLWAAYALLPWLFLFEYIKRQEWGADAPLPNARVGLLLIGVAAASVGVEYVHQQLFLGTDGSPLALQLLRRLPGIGVMVLLVGLSRREQERARRRPGCRSTETDAEALLQHAPQIRWIQAADNYLELHLDGHVWTRRITMREAAEILEPLGFVRVHRSVIVNRNHVDSIVPRSGCPAVRMSDGTALPTGRAFSANLRRLH